MREILFRGQTRKNGEKVEMATGEKLPGNWVYGGIFPGTGDYSIIYGGETEKDLERHVVYSETVGQYTGLHDATKWENLPEKEQQEFLRNHKKEDWNGKRIFEGDMIKPFDDEIEKMVVEFHHGQFLLCLYGERGYMAEYGWEEEGNYGCFEAEPLSSYGDDIEVIGNIHGNPELLEGGAT